MYLIVSNAKQIITQMRLYQLFSNNQSFSYIETWTVNGAIEMVKFWKFNNQNRLLAISSVKNYYVEEYSRIDIYQFDETKLR